MWWGLWREGTGCYGVYNSGVNLVSGEKGALPTNPREFTVSLDRGTGFIRVWMCSQLAHACQVLAPCWRIKLRRFEFSLLVLILTTLTPFTSSRVASTVVLICSSGHWAHISWQWVQYELQTGRCGSTHKLYDHEQVISPLKPQYFHSLNEDNK